MVLSPQLIGGAVAWSVWCIAGAWVAVLAVLTVLGRARLPRWRSGFAAALGALALTVFQAVPLPRALLGWTSAERLEQIKPSYDLLATERSWFPLSLDPGGTQLAILVAMAVVAAWVVAHGVAQTHGRRSVIEAVGASTVAMALAALVHSLAGVDRVWGFYEPRFARAGLVAPLLNSSHLGAFCAFGFPICLGLAMSGEQRSARFSWTAGAIACGIVVPFSGSRGALLGLAVSLVVMVGLLWRKPRSTRASGRNRWWALGGTVAAAAVAGLYLGYDQLRNGFANGDYEKVEVAARSMLDSLSTPVLGLGRGSYGAAYGALTGSQERYLHPENLVAQWVVEWGVIAGGIVLLALAVALFRVVLRVRRTASIGAAAALVGLVCHDLVDFSLEMAGVAVVAAATMAALGPMRRAGSRELPSRTRTRRVRALAGALAAGFAMTMAFGGPKGSFEAAADLWPDAPSWEGEGLPPELTVAIERHPLEPGLHLLAGYHAVRHERADAPGWLNRVMVLAPLWHSPHQLAARWLFARGLHGQAALEIREAERLSPRAGSVVACELAARSRSAEWVLGAAPSEPEGAVRFLSSLAHCLRDRPELVDAIDDRLVAVDPSAAGPIERAAARAESVEERIELLQRGLRGAPGTPSLELALGRALVDGDRSEEAIALLGETPHGRRELEVVARAQSRLGDHEGLEQSLVRLRGQAAGEAAGLASVHLFEAQLAREAGDSLSAVASLEKALELDPSPRLAVRVARQAEEAGSEARAQRAWTRACRRFRVTEACARTNEGDERPTPVGQPSP